MSVYPGKTASCLNPVVLLTHPKCNVHTLNCPEPQIHHYSVRGLWVNHACSDHVCCRTPRTRRFQQTEDIRKIERQTLISILRIRTTKRIDSRIGWIPTTSRQAGKRAVIKGERWNWGTQTERGPGLWNVVTTYSQSQHTSTRFVWKYMFLKFQVCWIVTLCLPALKRSQSPYHRVKQSKSACFETSVNYLPVDTLCRSEEFNLVKLEWGTKSRKGSIFFTFRFFTN
jgi:hypothetical protein